MKTFTDPKSGKAWNVRIIGRGDRYGRDDCLTVSSLMPMVEFYDADADEKFGERGQFVSRYFVGEFWGHDQGIDLYGSAPTWKISAEGFAPIVRWMRRECMGDR